MLITVLFFYSDLLTNHYSNIVIKRTKVSVSKDVNISFHHLTLAYAFTQHLWHNPL